MKNATCLIAIFFSAALAPEAFAVLDSFGMPVVTAEEQAGNRQRAPINAQEVAKNLADDVNAEFEKVAQEIFEKENLRIARAKTDLKNLDETMPKLKKFLEDCRKEHFRDYYSGSSSVTTYIPGEAQAHADLEHWNKVRPKLEAELKAMEEDLVHKRAVLHAEGLEALEKKFGGKQLPNAYGYTDIYRATQDLKIEGIQHLEDLPSKLDKKFVTFNVSDDSRIAYRKLERKASLARGRGAIFGGKFGRAGVVLGIAGAVMAVQGAQAQEAKSVDFQIPAGREEDRTDVISATLDD